MRRRNHFIENTARLAQNNKRYLEVIMIDIRFLRENPDVVKENIRKKFQDAKLPLVDEVIALDEASRKTQAEADDLR